MLSAESAAGKHPVAAARTMDNIIAARRGAAGQGPCHLHRIRRDQPPHRPRPADRAHPDADLAPRRRPPAGAGLGHLPDRHRARRRGPCHRRHGLRRDRRAQRRHHRHRRRHALRRRWVDQPRRARRACAVEAAVALPGADGGAPAAQVGLARAEAALGGARAFLYATVEDVWRTVEPGGAPSGRQLALARVACTQSVDAAAAVSRTANTLGGGSIYSGSTLQRRARDAEAITHHFTVAPFTWEQPGRVLLGCDPVPAFFRGDRLKLAGDGVQPLGRCNTEARHSGRLSRPPSTAGTTRSADISQTGGGAPSLRAIALPAF